MHHRTSSPTPLSRGLALTVVLLAQVMFVVDGTIVTIALPAIQDELGFTANGLAWVINAYALAFGAVMLLSGKVAGIIGPRRALIIGVALFVLASIGGGFAPTPELLILARVGQGLAAAVASPSGYMLIVSNTTPGRQRSRALSLTLVASACGGAAGLLAGGLLTELYGWRAVMFVNVPIGVAILLGAQFFIREGEKHRAALDTAGALISTAFMVCLVYSVTIFSGEAAVGSDIVGVAGMGVAAALLVILWLVERRQLNPVVPFSALSPRGSGPLFAAAFFLAAGMSTYLFFITLYMQQVLGYPPLQAALLLLPFLASQVVASQVGPFLVRSWGERVVGSVGMATLVVGQVWLSFLGDGLGPVAGIIAPTVLMGIGAGFAYPQLLGVILDSAPVSGLGTTSSLMNTASNLGGTIGIASLAGVSVVIGETAGRSAGLSTGMVGAAIYMAVAFTLFAARARRLQPGHHASAIPVSTVSVPTIYEDPFPGRSSVNSTK